MEAPYDWVDFLDPVEPIGLGFCGHVWSAKDQRSGEMIAVKCLPRRLYEANRLTFPPAEVRLAQELVHENIVRTTEAIERPKSILLLQEYLQGGDLFNCMQAVGLFSELVARFLFLDLFRAVRYLHAIGVVHRDLKPENCAFDANGCLKVLDFGLAARFSDGQRFHDFCGSREYASPQVIRRVPYEGPPNDVWALGVMLYDMVVGDLPFGPKATTFELDLGEEEDCDEDPLVSAELEDLLRLILKEDADARPTLQQIAGSEWMSTPPCLDDELQLRLAFETYDEEPELEEETPLARRMLLERARLLERLSGGANL